MVTNNSSNSGITIINPYDSVMRTELELIFSLVTNEMEKLENVRDTNGMIRYHNCVLLKFHVAKALKKVKKSELF